MAQAEKLVSVVIPTYNTVDYLPLAVRSALEQTYPKVEIHVVDDGSTDGTRQAMEQFRGNPKVKYHYQSNQGPARARNKGIWESRGEYIAFLDADDMWMPRKLEKQVPLFESSDSVGVVYSPPTLIDESGNVMPPSKGKCYRGKITAPLLVENFVGLSESVVRRECFEKLGGFDESLAMGMDYELWLRISTKYDFDYLEESTGYYRVWSRQLSKNYMKRFECRIKTMERFLRQHPNVIDEKTINKAWADAYMDRGYCSALESKRLEALKDYIFALRFRPTYPLAWKGMLKLLKDGLFY